MVFPLTEPPPGSVTVQVSGNVSVIVVVPVTFLAVSVTVTLCDHDVRAGVSGPERNPDRTDDPQTHIFRFDQRCQGQRICRESIMSATGSLGKRSRFGFQRSLRPSSIEMFAM